MNEDRSTPRGSGAAERAERVRRMLEARSVALVGASTRTLSVGNVMVSQLVRGGFSGDVYPVNPRYAEVEGLRCYPSVAEVPAPVDLAVLAVPNAVLEDQLQAAADAGAASAVIFGSAHDGGLGSAKDGGKPLTERIKDIAQSAGMALCGANGMGFCNLEHGLRVVGFYEPLERRPGNVALASHSGSVFSAMLHNHRDLEFNLAVSPGQELVTTTADYLHYALALDSTRVLALFLEAVRDPEAFVTALEMARDRDVPVVALKVGREPRASELVRAHSGALAGDDAAFEALFDAYGVQRAATLDEFVDTLELFAAGRRAAPGGLAAVHDSGGERAHLVDVAADTGVELATIGPETVAGLETTLEPGLAAVNPLDAWGTGDDFERIYRDCARLLHDDPATAALALVVDLTPEEYPEFSYLALTRELQGETTKPFAVVANLTSAIDADVARQLRRDGIPVLEGTATALAAFRRLLAYRDHRLRPSLRPPSPPPAPVRTRWRTRLTTGTDLAEHEGLELLADYGIPVVGWELVTDANEAVEAARRLGGRVALKTAAPGIAHKTDARGVVLSLVEPQEVREAYAELAGRLGETALVQRMADPGVELALGIVRDPQFGPLLIVGAGGIHVELLRDRRVALPPVDRLEARRLLDGLSVRPMLDGARGSASADLDSVADAVAALSVLASDLGEQIAALDVNPLVAGPGGCAAVDALVEPA